MNPANFWSQNRYDSNGEHSQVLPCDQIHRNVQGPKICSRAVSLFVFPGPALLCISLSPKLFGAGSRGNDCTSQSNAIACVITQTKKQGESSHVPMVPKLLCKFSIAVTFSAGLCIFGTNRAGERQ